MNLWYNNKHIWEVFMKIAVNNVIYVQGGSDKGLMGETLKEFLKLFLKLVRHTKRQTLLFLQK